MEAAEFLQPFLELEHQVKVALNCLERLKRMGVGQTRQARHLLIDLGVVFHRARPQWIKAAVN